jgi:hypothetical protein
MHKKTGGERGHGLSLDRGVDRPAMRNKIWQGHQKLLERRIYLIEINIGGKAVNACIAAASLRPEYKATAGNEVR